MIGKIVVHPGLILQSVLNQHGIDVNTLAKATKMSASRIDCIINQTSDINADTALRLEHALGLSAEKWMGLQNEYDLFQAKIKNPYIGKHVKRITKPPSLN